MRCVAIVHVAFEDLDAYGPGLQALGYRLEYRQAGVDDLGAPDVLSAELVVIMGGPIGANDEADFPFLLDELRLIESRIGRNLPVLGICLGAQLIARVLGSAVYPGTQSEIGWSPLTLTEAGRQTALAPLSGELTSVLHWHNDTFDLPQGAICLASTPACINQAFSFDNRVVALQFHPEVSAKGLERWLIGHIEQIGRMPDLTVERLRAQTATYAARLAPLARDFLQRWLAGLESTSFPEGQNDR